MGSFYGEFMAAFSKKGFEEWDINGEELS